MNTDLNAAARKAGSARKLLAKSRRGGCRLLNLCRLHSGQRKNLEEKFDGSRSVGDNRPVRLTLPRLNEIFFGRNPEPVKVRQRLTGFFLPPILYGVGIKNNPQFSQDWRSSYHTALNRRSCNESGDMGQEELLERHTIKQPTRVKIPPPVLRESSEPCSPASFHPRTMETTCKGLSGEGAGWGGLKDSPVNVLALTGQTARAGHVVAQCRLRTTAARGSVLHTDDRPIREFIKCAGLSWEGTAAPESLLPGVS
jgi:hypothetical protein